MTQAFNLLDEPWIPVRYVDGRTAEVGLLQLFTEANEIAVLAEPEPPSQVALYRLLLVIVHRSLARSLGTWRVADMERFYRNGLPVEAISGYLEQWREHFWLFHPEQPFMQVPALAIHDATREKFKPWTKISLAASSGSAPVLADHSVDNRIIPTDPANAIRKLLGFLQFTPGGLVRVFSDSDHSGPLANTAAVIPLDRTLAHTLCLALHPSPREGHLDLPTWERPPVDLDDVRAAATLATGPNDRYTRLSRSVLFSHDDTADLMQVSSIRFAEGVSLAEDEQARDPMVSYRAGKDSMVRIAFREGRSAWRDLASLLPDGTGKRNQPAAVLAWSANLFARVRTSEQTMLVALVAGMSSDQAKLLRWRSERVSLPEELLRIPDAADMLRDRLRAAEAMFVDLRKILAFMLVETMPNPDHKDTRALARSIVEAGPAALCYFSILERNLPILLEKLSSQDPSRLVAEWNRVMCIAASQTWSGSIRDLGNSARALRARAKAEVKYLALLNRFRPPQKHKTEERAV